MDRIEEIEKIRARHRRVTGNGAASLGHPQSPRELDLLNYHRATLEDVAALLAEVDRLRHANLKAMEEIEAWKSATGLERGGDPDAVRPDDLEKHIATLVHDNETMRADLGLEAP